MSGDRDADLLTAAETAAYCQIDVNFVFAAVTRGLLPRHSFVGDTAVWPLGEMKAMERKRLLVPQGWEPKRVI